MRSCLRREVCAESSATATAFPDGEVDGLGPAELARALPPPRSAADLRRALGGLSPPGPHRDVRDLLEPRGDAGGLGVRARGARLDLSGLPRVGDRAPPRDAGLDGSLLVARASGGLVEPGGVRRRVDLRADRDADSARGRVRVGLAAEGRGPRRDHVLRRRRDLRGRVPRGRELRGSHEGAGDPLLQQQPVGDLDSALGADGRADARRQGDRIRDAGPARRRVRRARRLRGDARGGRAGAGGRRPDVHRGGDVPGGAARDRGRPVHLHRPRARRGGAGERVCRPLRAVPAPLRASSPRSTREEIRQEALELMRAGIAEAEAEPPADPGSCSSTRTPSRRRRSPTTSRSCGGSSGRERAVPRRGGERRAPPGAGARRRPCS